ncbi:MAG TPA: protein kinase [Polyangium sp.]|nr:protein kinase [Polyangium sp.]
MTTEEPKLNIKVSLPSLSEIEAAPMSRRRVPPALASRYEDIRFLGEGGMGTVYRARDPRLGRIVAVKLLKGDNADLWQRFVAEARAQASIQHDNVCHIYDAGEFDGEPFIAMQYIDGEPLSKMKDKLPLEQSIRIMHQISMAVHEAHRLGIIHRDIKPGNILCEKLPDGTMKPYIMDFGLAREVEGKGQTQTGAVIGTPAYMPPEQAKGDVRAMDRRSDVYSLGATLYDVLAGRPPFVSENSWSLLMAVAYEDPPPLGKVKTGVPIDLETIVSKSIEREPARRYESAKALAEDLQRYLDGDPIFARRSSIGYVLWKKAKKNKWLTALVVTLIASALVLAGVWVRARRQAADQARLAQQLGEGVKEMELFLRAAYELPVHDVERERDVVRERLTDIEGRMSLAGKAGEGSGNYSLGRGYWALGNPEKAREYLEKSVNAGYVSTDLEYTLGLAYGELFRRAMDETKRITNEDDKKKKVAELEKTFRDPALVHLRAALSARIEVPAYAEGLIALYEGKNDEALAKAKAAFEKAPWMYEAKKLEGDALYAEGSKYRHDAAFDYDKMKSYFDPAAAAYRMAADMGRSDPETNRAECELWEKMALAVDMKGQPAKEGFEKAVNACTKAVDASSREGKTRVQKAIVMGSYLLTKVNTGVSAEEYLKFAEEATKAAKSAVDIAPNEVMAHYALAGVLQMQAYALQTSGKDASMKEAIASFQRALAIDPRFTWALSELGDAYGVEADNEENHGRDPTELRINAIKQFEQAINVDPKYSLAAGRRLVNYRKLLEHYVARGQEAPEALKSLLDGAVAYEKMSPGPWLVAYWNVRVHVLQAAYENAFGRSPLLPLEIVKKTIQSFAGEHPEDYWFLLASIETHVLEASYIAREGQDASKLIEEVRNEIKRGIEIKKTVPSELREHRARIEIIALRDAKRKGKLEAKTFDTALEFILPVLNTTDANPLLYSIHAEILAMRGQWASEKKLKINDDLDKGLASIEKALAMNERMAHALAVKGFLLSLKSRNAAPGAQRLALVADAKKAFDAAFRQNPLLEREYGSWAKEWTDAAP